MTKAVRNGIITASVVAVTFVAGFAAVKVYPTLKQPANKEEASVTASQQEQNFNYPDTAQDATSTTADILSDILDSIETQTENQATAPNGQVATQPSTSGRYTSAQTTRSGATNAPATQAPAARSTTAKAPTTKASATSAKTTKATTAKATTTKAPATTAASDKDPITTVSGQEAMSTGGVVSYLWNPDGNFYYVDDAPWQRNFGFNVIYDWAAAMLVMYYDTWRACFTYDNTEWMIQSWKGQYGFLFIGGEIGVYTRDPGEAVVTGTHYHCADDNHLINMEMSIYYDAHDGNGYKKLFTRSYYPHWWSTGFVDGHLADYKFNDRSCLIMIARLTMYDAEMTDAFTTALEGCGFRRVESRDQISTTSSDTYTTVGNDVYFSWKTIDQGYKTR